MTTTRERIMDIRDELLQLVEDLSEIDEETGGTIYAAYEVLERAL